MNYSLLELSKLVDYSIQYLRLCIRQDNLIAEKVRINGVPTYRISEKEANKWLASKGAALIISGAANE